MSKRAALAASRSLSNVPELPEVETIRRGLEIELLGRSLVSVAVANPKILKGQSDIEFRQRAIGKRVIAANRRGKYLLMPLAVDSSSSPTITLCIHLKMRGSLRIEPSTQEPGHHHGVSLGMDDGRSLRYYDSWGWGELRALTEAELEAVGVLKQLGPEPVGDEWSADVLQSRLSGRKTAIKVALLDQGIVGGVGNIYADEALFRARLAPQRPSGELSAAEVGALAGTLRAVLTDAVAQGGSRGEYVNLYGEPGLYAPQVYGRGQEPCPVCAQLLCKIRLGGRGTTYCPTCQH